MAKLEHESNQLNMAVVALVALVAIVGLVALVLNTASIADITENLATGPELAEAQPDFEEALEEENLVGDRRAKRTKKV